MAALPPLPKTLANSSWRHATTGKAFWVDLVIATRGGILSTFALVGVATALPWSFTLLVAAVPSVFPVALSFAVLLVSGGCFPCPAP